MLRSNICKRLRVKARSNSSPNVTILVQVQLSYDIESLGFTLCRTQRNLGMDRDMKVVNIYLLRSMF